MEISLLVLTGRSASLKHSDEHLPIAVLWWKRWRYFFFYFNGNGADCGVVIVLVVKLVSRFVVIPVVDLLYGFSPVLIKTNPVTCRHSTHRFDTDTRVAKYFIVSSK